MKNLKQLYFPILTLLTLLPFQNCSPFDASQKVTSSSSSATDTSGGSSVILPPATGSFEVYPGCEAPATSFTRTLYADPTSGLDSNDGSAAAPLRTVSAAFLSHKVQPGDKIIAKAGNHGALNVTQSTNAELASSNAWVLVEGEDGAIFSSVNLSGVSRIVISHFEVSSPGYTGNLVSLNRTTHVVVANSAIYSTKDTSSWTANTWINGAASGVGVADGTCSSIVHNVVKNVRFGIVAVTNSSLPPANRINTLFFENTIQYFSADGFRPNASNVLFKNNRILDVLVNDTDGDENHDDAIQGFSLGPWGSVNFENVVIDGNWVQESTEPATRFRAGEQGISVFDGLYTNIAIRNNVVICSSWHGISLYGPDHGVIENNTVVGIDPRMTSWISIVASKAETGSHPAIAPIIRNNIAAKFLTLTRDEMTATNNFEIPTTEGAANYVKYDLSTQIFDPHLRPTSSAFGKGAGVYP